jgi:predicted RNA-binding protein
MNNSTSQKPARTLFRKEKPTLVFKIFFNPETGRCLHKTTGDAMADLPYIEVDHATYTQVDVCNNFKVVNGQLEKIKLITVNKKLTKSASGIFKTTKNNMIFIVGPDYTGPTDTWDYSKYEY